MKLCSSKPSISNSSHRWRCRARVTWLCLQCCNVVVFLYHVPSRALLVTSFFRSAGTEGQLNTVVRTGEEMCLSGEKIPCLCKTWPLAYSHTTHSTANYTFARDICRAEHTAAICSVSCHNLSHVEEDIALFFNLPVPCSHIWNVSIQFWFTNSSKNVWIPKRKKKKKETKI